MSRFFASRPCNSYKPSTAKNCLFADFSFCPDVPLLIGINKNKALLVFENFANENTGSPVVFLSSIYVTKSSSNLVFYQIPFSGILVGSSKTKTLPAFGILTFAYNAPMVTTQLIRNELLISWLVGEYHICDLSCFL